MAAPAAAVQLAAGSQYNRARADDRADAAGEETNPLWNAEFRMQNSEGFLVLPAF